MNERLVAACLLSACTLWLWRRDPPPHCYLLSFPRRAQVQSLGRFEMHVGTQGLKFHCHLQNVFSSFSAHFSSVNGQLTLYETALSNILSHKFHELVIVFP